MKRVAAVVLLLVCAFAAPRVEARRTHVPVAHDGPVKVRHLVGTVVDARGFAVEYCAIELRDGVSHKVIATTFADAQGRFAFADRKRGERLELRASHAGFNPVEYAVVIATFGRERLRMVLAPAT